MEASIAMKRNGTIHASRIAGDMPVAAILPCPARTEDRASAQRSARHVTHRMPGTCSVGPAMLGAAIAQ